VISIEIKERPGLSNTKRRGFCVIIALSCFSISVSVS